MERILALRRRAGKLGTLYFVNGCARNHSSFAVAKVPLDDHVYVLVGGFGSDILTFSQTLSRSAFTGLGYHFRSVQHRQVHVFSLQKYHFPNTSITNQLSMYTPNKRSFFNRKYCGNCHNVEK